MVLLHYYWLCFMGFRQAALVRAASRDPALAFFTCPFLRCLFIFSLEISVDKITLVLDIQTLFPRCFHLANKDFVR